MPLLPFIQQVTYINATKVDIADMEEKVRDLFIETFPQLNEEQLLKSMFAIIALFKIVSDKA